MGKAHRKRVGRRSLGRWRVATDRPDPIELLRSQDEIRLLELVPIRYGRMVSSPFSFFRGSAVVMAADLAASPTTELAVQACGDAHIDNFGVYAGPDRHLVYDVNDFDETLPAPWDVDVRRLATSLVLAAREKGWSDDAGIAAVIAAVTRYRDVLAELATITTLEIQYARLDEARFFDEFTDPRVVKNASRVLRHARRRTNEQAYRKWVSTLDGPDAGQLTVLPRGGPPAGPKIGVSPTRSG